MKADHSKTLITKCECFDPGHIMTFYLADWEDDWPPELYIRTQLNPLYHWWGRCWEALGYILGRQSRFGHWGEGSISRESAEKLLPILIQFIDHHKRAIEDDWTE